MSKGSKQRPTDLKKFDEGWDRIFGNKQESAGWVCPKCGIDRTKDQCPLFNNMPRMIKECPMVIEAQ